MINYQIMSTYPSSTQICSCVCLLVPEKWSRNEVVSTSELERKKKSCIKVSHLVKKASGGEKPENLTKDLVHVLLTNIDTKSFPVSQLGRKTLNIKSTVILKRVNINIALPNNIRFPVPSLCPFGRGPRHPDIWMAALVILNL